MKRFKQYSTLLFVLVTNIGLLNGQAILSDSVKTDSVSLDVMIGQMIITGVGDFSYITEEKAILKDVENGYVGGVIFFEKNINKNSPKKQLKRAIDSLQAKSKIPLFVSIDEEGGRVNRLKPKYGFPKTMRAQYLGNLDNLDSTRFYAQNTAATLSELGINVNFAPTVDVNINPENPVIGRIGRSYSGSEEVVAKHAGEVIKTHRENGVITVLKHFPGHGSSQADTHLGIADVTDFWQFRELMPYKYLLDSGLVDAVMTAHIVNAHLDENKLPATLSSLIVNNILRNVLGYNGVVFSDDMQMHAISKEFGFEDAVKMSINAGVDVIMFANNVEDHEKRKASEVHDMISKLVNEGKIPVERIQESYKRIIQLKSRL